VASGKNRRVISRQVPGLTVTYEFFPEDQICVWSMSGRLTIDTMVAGVRAARADPRWSNDYDFLTVMTDASLGDVSAQDTAELVHHLAALDTPRTDGKGKRAAVVCSDEVAAGLLTYYELHSRTERMTDERYFRSEAAARAWLAQREA
tara:strand:- start:7337 stop:7780 length:444 start_codon:yes stop_codon:yes gene_type:complete